MESGSSHRMLWREQTIWANTAGKFLAEHEIILNSIANVFVARAMHWTYEPQRKRACYLILATFPWVGNF